MKKLISRIVDAILELVPRDVKIDNALNTITKGINKLDKAKSKVDAAIARDDALIDSCQLTVDKLIAREEKLVAAKISHMNQAARLERIKSRLTEIIE